MFGEPIPWGRLSVDIIAMIFLCLIAVALDHSFGSSAPAGGIGYLWGATSFARYRWIKTGEWSWP